MGDKAAEVAPHGEEGPPPAVLARIKPPNGKAGLVSSDRSSATSFASPNFRKKGELSSLLNRLLSGEFNPDTESAVCWRRVLGRLEAGEEVLKVFP